MEWKDIKDAPRDGTIILVYLSDKDGGNYELLKFEDGEWNNGISFGWDEKRIIGWMPLPEKPEKKKHQCTNERFAISGIVTCYESNNTLFVRTCCFEYMVIFCPFCGFTLNKKDD